MGQQLGKKSKRDYRLIITYHPTKFEKAFGAGPEYNLAYFGTTIKSKLPIWPNRGFFGIFHQRDFYLLIKTYHAEKFEKNIGVYTKT